MDLSSGDLAAPCSDPGRPCAAGERCYKGVCVRDRGACKADAECGGDTYCEMAVCVPYALGGRGGVNPDCKGSGFLVGEFAPPVEVCRWKPPPDVTGNVVSTPLVIDLDGDKRAEIVFATTENKKSGLFAIHGADCTPLFERPNLGLLERSQIAAADLDGDKIPEIVAINNAGKVQVFDAKGNPLALSASYSLPLPGNGDCSGPAIADVDGDGVVEIAVAGLVVQYRRGMPLDPPRWSKAATPGKSAWWGALSLFADLDGKPPQELVTGLRVYDMASGEDKTPKTIVNKLNPLVGAYPQVADFNGDKRPDLLLVQSQKGQQTVSIVDVANDKLLFGPAQVTGGGWGGPAVIADLDGDGVVDFGLAGPDRYYAYALRCAADPKPADCKGSDPGVLWTREIRDLETGGNGSAAFDFNGDGRAEIVHRDKCWLRVMNGPDGRTLFARPVTSGTCLETPVIADLDGDGRAELVVTADSIQGAAYCENVAEGQTGEIFAGPSQGVIVLRDPGNRWSAARPIWNQHTYHVTNVGDDGSVPASEVGSWTVKPFGYRQNSGDSAAPVAQPDFTVGEASAPCKAKRLQARLCNRGAAAAAAGVPATFYDGDPAAGGKAICSAKSSLALKPGDCEPIGCDWPSPREGSDVWVLAANDGGKAPAASQCERGNDGLVVRAIKCPD